MEQGPEKREKYAFDEKSGHVKYKGSLRPDGTQRRDRMIKISTAIEHKTEEMCADKYVPPYRRDKKYDDTMKDINDLKDMNDLKITIVNDQYQKKEKLLSFLNNEIGDYKCICNRIEKSLVCANCGHSAKGRILRICRKHPLDFKATDLSYCPECKSHQLYLIEQDQKGFQNHPPPIYSLMKTSETKKEEDTKENPKKGPFIKEEPKEGRTIKKEPVEKPNVKEGPAIIKEEPQEEEPRLVTVKKKVSFSESEVNVYPDENNNEGVPILLEGDKMVQDCVHGQTKTFSDKCPICILFRLNEKLDKMAAERAKALIEEQNNNQNIQIPVEIDQRVESWFAGDTWAYKPLGYDPDEPCEHPYKPAKYDPDACICKRNPSFVVCGFCGFGEDNARIKIPCAIHPEIINEKDISPCPDCKFPGFLVELVRHEA